MSFALPVIATVAEVVSLVSTYGPQLIGDTTALQGLFDNASAAVKNANPDGTVQQADWDTLHAHITDLQAQLDEEAARAQSGG